MTKKKLLIAFFIISLLPMFGGMKGIQEVILKPVDENVETGYVAEYLTHGMPVKLDAVKGEWFKVGVAVQNDSERGPIAVSVEIFERNKG